MRIFNLLGLIAFAALRPDPASAKVDPRMSAVDPVVVGDTGGARTFRVQLRGVDNAPAAGVVTLDFSGSPVRLEATQESGTTVDCAAHTLSRPAGAFGHADYGRAEFHPRFGGSCAGADIVVRGDGIVLAHIPARSTDLDGIHGTDLHDLAQFSEAFAHEGHPEMDFDGSGGVIGLGDFRFLALAFLSGSNGSYCP
jgi:hypothetical protein